MLSKAYLPNIFIGDITRNTYDLFQHAKSNNLSGLMLQIDFSKAFDSISFEFIENTLKLFNLNPKYISWINTLLKKPEKKEKHPQIQHRNKTIRFWHKQTIRYSPRLRHRRGRRKVEIYHRQSNKRE